MWTSIVIALVAIFIIVGIVGRIAWWTTFDTSDGERHRRRRMQGPFVPIGDDGDERGSGRPRADPRDQG